MEHLRSVLDRDNVTNILKAAGYDFERQFNFKLREERTASAVVNANGTIHDYGSDFHGDIFDVLKSRGMSFPESKRFVMDQLGISHRTSIEINQVSAKKIYYVDQLSDKRHKEIVSFVDQCDRSKCQTFRDEGYVESALSIAPFWLYRDAAKESLELFKKFTTYDEFQKSIILKICDYDGKLISYKHRYLTYRGGKKMKWFTTPKTHPNQQCMASLHMNDSLTIYVVEGSRDFLTMILLGLNVVAIPTVNYKHWNNHEMYFFMNRNVVFIPDIDLDLKGVSAMEILAELIQGTAKSINIIDCRKITYFQNIICDNEKVDLSDVVSMWDEHIKSFSNKQNDKEVKTIYAFKSSLQYVSELAVMLPEGEVF